MSTTKSSIPPFDSLIVSATGISTSGDLAFVRSPRSPLGIYAETYSTQGTARLTDEGVILDAPRDSRTARAERFLLKSAAVKLLPKDHRTKKCHRWRLPSMEIQVKQGATKGRAFYHGLQVCAMPWTCPVCASKISERRRAEVAKAIANADAIGWKSKLLTLTVPHGIGDDVKSMVDQMMKAWTSLWQGRRGVELRHSLGLKGHIRALEVTYGKNGFHPHFHAILFVDPKEASPVSESLIGQRWQQAAERAGLPRPSDLRGCKLEGGEHVARYLTKGVWGLENEVTKGHQKRGKNGSITPLDMLERFMKGDHKSGALWRSYVDAFQSRRQLYWSNGLKKLLLITDYTDEELANAPEDVQSLILATVTDSQWQAIYRRRLETTVLDLAEISPDLLRVFLEGLVLDD